MSNDFHQPASLPAVVTIGELSWGDRFVAGAQIIGVPCVVSGRNNFISWSLTTSVSDTTDLWDEEINDDGTQYKVDGEWRSISKIIEKIYVKDQDPIDFEIGYTHRGPIVDYQTLNIEKLLPDIDILSKRKYSFGWPLTFPGDSSI